MTLDEELTGREVGHVNIHVAAISHKLPQAGEMLSRVVYMLEHMVRIDEVQGRQMLNGLQAISRAGEDLKPSL